MKQRMIGTLNTIISGYLNIIDMVYVSGEFLIDIVEMLLVPMV
jgi:hypothetical protein